MDRYTVVAVIGVGIIPLAVYLGAVGMFLGIAGLILADRWLIGGD